MECLPYSFYNRYCLDVAQDLLGKTFVFKNIKGIITETEAYRGPDDPASHAFRGITPRNQIMFSKAGYSYVYFIYGMYYCFNVVTEEEGSGSAVLIRGLQLPDLHLNGPGKMCRHLGINKTHYGLDLTSNPELYIAPGLTNITYTTTPRIGISKAQDKPWRFVLNPILGL